MPRVLLVDDDIELGRMLAEYLAAEGFEVSVARDGEDALRRAGAHDLVVLDVMMPGLSGTEVLRRLRRNSGVPVLMLTARGDDVDRIIGLELGADDYLPKPCNPRELVARLHAILRRTGAAGGSAPARTIVAGDMVLRPGERIAEWRGQALDLTSTEFNVLAALAARAGAVVSKADLAPQALGRPLARYDRSIDMHVSNLRQKLGSLADGRSPIQTVRGMGYQLIVK